MTAHWAAQYIGRRWAAGATGPEYFDCWGLFRHVQHEQFGIEVPAIAPDSYGTLSCAKTFRDHPEREHWQPIGEQAPQEGDCVLMSSGNHPRHIGVWLAVDGGGVLHCVQGAGVVYQSLQALKRGGWGRLIMCRHTP